MDTETMHECGTCKDTGHNEDAGEYCDDCYLGELTAEQDAEDAAVYRYERRQEYRRRPYW